MKKQTLDKILEVVLISLSLFSIHINQYLLGIYLVLFCIYIQNQNKTK